MGSSGGSHPLDQAELERLPDEVQRLTDSEDSRVVFLTAERDKYKRLFGEYVADRRRLVGELRTLKAQAERAQPVLDKARAWRRWFPHANSMFVPENELIAAVDAHRLSGCVDETADSIEEDLRTERRLPVCVECGHRHRWGGECADHSWGDACPYDAGAGCEGPSSTDATGVVDEDVRSTNQDRPAVEAGVPGRGVPATSGPTNQHRKDLS